MKKEDHKTEFKRSWRDEYLKWICAFANADGGTLYIGIDDDGTVVGVSDAKRLLEDIPNKIASTMGLVCSISTVRRKGKSILKIVVKPSATPISYHGEFHVRSGATKQLLTGPALTQFILDKTGVKWDGLTVDGVGVEELDHESFEIFARNAIASGRMSRNDVEVNRGELLDKLGLLKNGKLTNAAILLFHRRPDRWVSSCYSQIGYFANDVDLKFQDEIRGSLMIQAERIMELLFLKYLTAPISYRGMLRIDNYPYPKDAVRELVYNALMHQDFVNGGSVQVSVYPDKLYISNSGGLPPNWTVSTLMGKHRSEVRNNLIASVFYRAGFVERWGRGIEKIRSGLKEHGNPEPVYDATASDVMVRLDAIGGIQKGINGADGGVTQNVTQNVTQKPTRKLTGTQKAILELIKKDSSISQTVMAKCLGLNRRTIIRNMASMSDIVRRVGAGRGRRWEIMRELETGALQ